MYIPFCSCIDSMEEIPQATQSISSLILSKVAYSPLSKCARLPGGSRCKRGLTVQFSVHFNHFQMTNS